MRRITNNQMEPASTEPSALARLARNIEARGVWSQFLRPREQKLLTAALDAGDEIWARFICGQVPCRVRLSTAEGSHDEELEVDALALAFRVRYMLWDVIISGSDSHELEESGPVKSSAPVNDADDDYDMGDDEPAEQLTEKATGSEELVVEISEEDVDSGEDSRAHRAVLANYNRQYHTFEKDRVAMAQFRKLQENDRAVDVDRPPLENLSSTAQFGAANLSLKHLLATIEARRDETKLTDIELRNLISDVRKNRSKWASEERIGQEELYESCEKVVQELRATTEHSTAFLNKVNKRDAPNYYQVIKNPMDLNTVMRKLRSLQYNSKQEFVEDLMLIWHNCLVYNSDPRHFLRAHAIAMRRKTQALIPLIPNVTIRSRAEVEAEAQQIAQSTQKDNAVGGKATGKSTRRAAKGNKSSTNGESESLMGEESGDAAKEKDPNLKEEEGLDVSQEGIKTSGSKDGNANDNADPSNKDMKEPDQNATNQAVSTPDVGSESVDQSDLKESKDGADSSEAGAEGSSPDENSLETEPSSMEEDLETETWQSATKRRRVEYLQQRHNLFAVPGGAGLDTDAPVALRRSAAMARFFRGVAGEASEPCLVEYDIVSGLPEPPLSEGLAALPATSEGLPPSRYLARGYVPELYLRNLNEMQSIRHLCAKINMIREMQANPGQPIQTEIPKYPAITDPPEDVASRIPGASPMYGPAALAGMRSAVAKIAMHNGFEAAQRPAVDCLAEVGSDYMSKLARNIVADLEAPNHNETTEKLLTGVLGEFGVSKLDNLSRYIVDDIWKAGKRLTGFRLKLVKILGELLMPEIKKYKDEQFSDNSDEFVLGQFSTELGDDYFGFRELGIDQDLGLANLAVPFHLLQQRIAADAAPLAVSRDKQYDLPEYPPLSLDCVPLVIGLLQNRYAHFASTTWQEPPRPKLAATAKLTARKRPTTKAFRRPKVPESKPPPLLQEEQLKKDEPSTHEVEPDNSFVPTEAIGGEEIDMALEEFEALMGQ